MKLKRIWTIFFPLIFITAFYYLSIAIDNYINLPKMPINLNFLGFIFISVGIILILSVFYLFDVIGEGTPVPKQITSKFATKKLVVKGPFKYTRNPMAIGFFLIFIGIAFIRRSYAMFFLTAVMVVIGHLFIVHVEEKDMEKRFGKDYLQYKKKVPRWLPRIHS